MGAARPSVRRHGRQPEQDEIDRDAQQIDWGDGLGGDGSSNGRTRCAKREQDAKYCKDQFVPGRSPTTLQTEIGVQTCGLALYHFNPKKSRSAEAFSSGSALPSAASDALRRARTYTLT
jgi:hypothetical protein